MAKPKDQKSTTPLIYYVGDLGPGFDDTLLTEVEWVTRPIVGDGTGITSCVTDICGHHSMIYLKFEERDTAGPNKDMVVIAEFGPDPSGEAKPFDPNPEVHISFPCQATGGILCDFEIARKKEMEDDPKKQQRTVYDNRNSEPVEMMKIPFKQLVAAIKSIPTPYLPYNLANNNCHHFAMLLYTRLSHHAFSDWETGGAKLPTMPDQKQVTSMCSGGIVYFALERTLCDTVANVEPLRCLKPLLSFDDTFTSAIIIEVNTWVQTREDSVRSRGGLDLLRFRDVLDFWLGDYRTHKRFPHCVCFKECRDPGSLDAVAKKHCTDCTGVFRVERRRLAHQEVHGGGWSENLVDPAKMSPELRRLAYELSHGGTLTVTQTEMGWELQFLMVMYVLPMVLMFCMIWRWAP